MRVYIVFAGQTFYPTGPGDIKSTHTDEDEAMAAARAIPLFNERSAEGDSNIDWVTIAVVDTDTATHSLIEVSGKRPEGW